MNDLIAGIQILSLLIFALSMGFGVNLNKWYGWAQVLSGFLFGFLTGQNLPERVIIGIFFGLLTIILGPFAWKRRH